MGFVKQWGEDQTMDLIDQYAGESERAFARTGDRLAWKGRSYRHYRMQRWWRAFLAGGIAATCLRQRTLAASARAAAERYARALERDRNELPRAMASALRGALAHRLGDAGTAERTLRDAVAGFGRLRLGAYTLGAERALGLVVGGDEGRTLIERCDAKLRAEGVARPDRLVEAFVPGFAD